MSTGWSLLPGRGTAALFNKLNGTAWQVLTLANETEEALEAIETELVSWRTVVIRHRLELDTLLAEKGRCV